MSEQQATRDTAQGAQSGLLKALAENIGKRAACVFLVGTQLVERQGLIDGVDGDTLTLLEESSGMRTICDALSLRFASLTESAAAGQATEPGASSQPQTAETVRATLARPASAQAAFNYAKRKARR